MNRVRIRRWLTSLLAAMSIAASIQACGKGGNHEWIVAWNTSWTGPESDKPVSRDGRYAYFVTEKFINPTSGRWDKRWRSAPFRGRVDLMTGRVDTGQWPNGYHLFGAGLLISDTLSQLLVRDNIEGGEGITNEIRVTGYGDGRYCIYIRRKSGNTDRLVTLLLDNEYDTYIEIGTEYRDGWLSTDERRVVLVKSDSGDTWIFDIAERKLRKLDMGESFPRYYRGLTDLPVEAQQIASMAMGRHCTQRRFHYSYPAEEERL